jgi:hypothetical protein
MREKYCQFCNDNHTAFPNKNSLNSIFSFSLGLFTAFTVAWNGPTLSIFFITFIILLIGILFIASIRATATVEERLTTAANSYVSDFETNKKDLQEVKASVTKQGGLLSIEKTWEAIVFFAYQKVPKTQMITLINALNYLYTVTKVETESLLVLLNNMNHLSHTETDLATNISVLKLYVLRGKSTPGNLVTILNDALHIAIENDIDFVLFTDTILTYLSSTASRKFLGSLGASGGSFVSPVKRATGRAIGVGNEGQDALT